MQNKNDNKSRKRTKDQLVHGVMEKYGYDIGRLIGCGSSADVRLAFSSSEKRHVAVKIISKKEVSKDFVKLFVPREISILKKLEHKNIIRFIKAIQTPDLIFIIMEWAQNGTLLQAITREKYIDEPRSCIWFHHLLDGIMFLHSKSIVHRDIKCENLLLDKFNIIKISDFGFSRGKLPAYIINEEENINRNKVYSNTFCGSYAYASPEILMGKPYEPHLSDVWSMGVVLYIMVCGHLPFKDDNLAVLVKKVQEPLEFPSTPVLSNICKDLICSILSPLESRLYIPQIRKHKWYNFMYDILSRKKDISTSVTGLHSKRRELDKYQRIATLRHQLDKVVQSKKDQLKDTKADHEIKEEISSSKSSESVQLNSLAEQLSEEPKEEELEEKEIISQRFEQILKSMHQEHRSSLNIVENLKSTQKLDMISSLRSDMEEILSSETEKTSQSKKEVFELVKEELKSGSATLVISTEQENPSIDISNEIETFDREESRNNYLQSIISIITDKLKSSEILSFAYANSKEISSQRFYQKPELSRRASKFNEKSIECIDDIEDIEQDKILIECIDDTEDIEQDKILIELPSSVTSLFEEKTGETLKEETEIINSDNEHQLTDNDSKFETKVIIKQNNLEEHD